MTKDWQKGSTFTKAPKIEKGLGVGKDGFLKGGIDISKKASDPSESQTNNAKYSKRMLASKSKKVTWY
jgi:hypothetical protein|tara:strand:+ start:143 stop:346 length:204 start_codon:yes stop_codon:yes gene_type:complete